MHLFSFLPCAVTTNVNIFQIPFPFCLGLEAWQARSAGQGSIDTDMPDFSFAPQEYITQIGTGIYQNTVIYSVCKAK
jgi:hypothetical protein